MDKCLRKMCKIIKLDDGLYAISSSAVQTYVLVGREKALVLDTAYGFFDLSAAVREITKLPLIVMNSHGHIDHTGSNFYFREPVYIHEKDRELYRLHNDPAFHRELEKSLKLFQRIIFWRTLIPEHPEENDEKRVNFSNFLFLKERDSFDLGGMHAEIIDIPGHTAGSVAVWIPERKLIFTSDGANPGTWLFLPESEPLSVYRESLRKIEALPFERILTGHTRKFFMRGDLQDWIRVAEDPDIENGKVQNQEYLAPDCEVRRVFAKGDTKKKAAIMLKLEKKS